MKRRTQSKKKNIDFITRSNLIEVTKKTRILNPIVLKGLKKVATDWSTKDPVIFLRHKGKFSEERMGDSKEFLN